MPQARAGTAGPALSASGSTCQLVRCASGRSSRTRADSKADGAGGILRHQVVQYTLGEELRAICRQHGGFAVGSPIDIVFSDYDVVQPDLIVFGPARAHLVDLDRAIRHAPDLCVEVLSPSTEATDRGRKLQMFARYGVPEYWIVDPAAGAIEVYRLADGAYTLLQVAAGEAHVNSPTLEGLTFKAARIFP